MALITLTRAWDNVEFIINSDEIAKIGQRTAEKNTTYIKLSSLMQGCAFGVTASGLLKSGRVIETPEEIRESIININPQAKICLTKRQDGQQFNVRLASIKGVFGSASNEAARLYLAHRNHHANVFGMTLSGLLKPGSVQENIEDIHKKIAVAHESVHYV
jgi:hypothetical protein